MRAPCGALGVRPSRIAPASRSKRRRAPETQVRFRKPGPEGAIPTQATVTGIPSEVPMSLDQCPRRKRARPSKPLGAPWGRLEHPSS
eukprot:6501804-Pyramimonas_sp.AAC.1